VHDRIEDIQDLLPEVDLLITDYSSIALDFFLTGRPVIFFPYDLEEYDARRGFSIDYLKDLPGPFAFDGEELLERLRTSESWSGSTEYRRKYAAVRDRYHKYKDARSAERLYARLVEELDRA
jgi:CDP-glycerol glycerophosphotransferase (TagB/SpsB family)